MKKFIFLDFDGVMDTSHHCNRLYHEGLPEADKYGTVFDPECVENLNLIIKETGAEIVITSSWKEIMSYEQILQMWKDRGLPGFVTDTTLTCSNHHGDEIASWLDIYRHISGETEYTYVIIDDMGEADFSEDQLEHLVTTDFFYGLDENVRMRAIEVLNEKENLFK